MISLGKIRPDESEAVEAVYYKPAKDGDNKPVVKKVTAASQLFPQKNVTKKSGVSTSGAGETVSKQQKAWKMYDEHPEVRFYATWTANAMSKVRLFAGRETPDGEIEPLKDPSHEATVLTSMIANGRVGQSGFLKRYGALLAVAGEGWTVVVPDITGLNRQDLVWEVFSRSEVKIQGSRIKATINETPVEIDTQGEVSIYEQGFAIRIWTSHPNKRLEADSPIIGSLSLLEELSLLNAAIMSIAQSRITGRGILFVPEGISIPQGTEEQGDSDDIMEALLEASEIAIQEPNSAAAAVPLLVQVPAEMIASIQHITFESDFDEIAIRLREEIIGRFATGIDTPSEILLGHRDANHWQAWLNQTEAVRMAVEPKVQEVCEALTYQWLRPALYSLGVENPSEYVVWYDSSALKMNANRPQAALEAWNAGLIKASAARRELGFDESDAPDAPDRDEFEPDQESPESRERIQLPTEENRNARELPSIERVERVVEDEGM